MTWMKYPVTTVAVALSLELHITPGLTTQRQVLPPQRSLDQKTGIDWEVSQFQPRPGTGAPPSAGTAGGRFFQPRPGTGAPPSTGTAGGRFRFRFPPDIAPYTGGEGRRSGSCVSSSEKHLTALIPKNQIGLTVSEYPTFFGYIPKSSAKTGEFILMNQSGRVIYRTSFAIPSQPGIVSISLPTKALPPLEMGKIYQWYLVLVCNPDDRSDNEISAPAWIQRTQLSQTAANQFQTATPYTRPEVYAADGIWYEALASLVALRQEQPNNPQFIRDWEKLLKSVGLEAFIQEPLLKCCQIKN